MTTNDLILRIWKALAKPAASYDEIVERVNAALHDEGKTERVDYARVSVAISSLRQADPGDYGWVVPHCKRGRSTDGRLFRAVYNASGVLLSSAKSEAIVDGAVGTTSHVRTIMEHGAKMMKGVGPQLPDIRLRRAAKGMVRKMEFVAAEAQEMYEALVAQRPNGTNGTP